MPFQGGIYGLRRQERGYQKMQTFKRMALRTSSFKKLSSYGPDGSSPWPCAKALEMMQSKTSSGNASFESPGCFGKSTSTTASHQLSVQDVHSARATSLAAMLAAPSQSEKILSPCQVPESGRNDVDQEKEKVWTSTGWS